MSRSADLTAEIIAEKYELLRLLGRGGMGAVYEARHIGTHKRCAVKLLLQPELASDAEVHKRFFREARASGLIESEHVVAAYDSGIDAKGRVYYVMECLSGEDLAERLRRGPLRASAAIKLALQAATGLASAHALGIVHRDIKPANLFLARAPGGDLKVKILDFGVAKVKMEVFGESADSYTRGGSLLGTPQYMSPEQMKRAADITEAADVWSLGVVLFECLTGKLPWTNVESIGELLAAILTAEVPSVQDAAPWVPPELAALVQRALSRDLAHRLQDAAELQSVLLTLTQSARLTERELEPITDDERSSVAPRFVFADTLPIRESSSKLAVVTSASPPTSPRKRGFVAVALAAATAATVGAWALRPGTSAPRPRALTALHRQAVVPEVPPIVDGGEASLGAESAQPAPAIQRLSLAIVPPGASVLIDGKAARVTNGQVTIEGAIGDVRRVRVTHRRQSREARVYITVQGLEPTRVALPSTAPTSPAPPTMLAESLGGDTRKGELDDEF